LAACPASSTHTYLAAVCHVVKYILPLDRPFHGDISRPSASQSSKALWDLTVETILYSCWPRWARKAPALRNEEDWLMVGLTGAASQYGCFLEEDGDGNECSARLFVVLASNRDEEVGVTRSRSPRLAISVSHKASLRYHSEDGRSTAVSDGPPRWKRARLVHGADARWRHGKCHHSRRHRVDRLWWTALLSKAGAKPGKQSRL
jgi:hypothetical protein